MTERPILFSGPMVRAVLAGTKTQTRRVIRGAPDGFAPEPWLIGHQTVGVAWKRTGQLGTELRLQRSPYGATGDRLWVRENGWERPERTPRMMRDGADTWPKYAYDADGIDAYNAEQYKEWGWKRRPSIHMPRWACRLVLEVTGIRVERLQDISTADCEAEGCGHVMPFSAQQMYQQLWISINGVASWNANPWVWVVEFKRTATLKGAA